MEKKFMDEGKRSSMTAAKIRHLESIGFKWAKRKGQISWDLKYSELCAFYRHHLHCDVPTKFGENRALGRWVSTQRSEFKKYQQGRSKQMTRERIDKLNQLNFKWEILTQPTAAGPGNKEGGGGDEGEEGEDQVMMDVVKEEAEKVVEEAVPPAAPEVELPPVYEEEELPQETIQV